MTWKSISEYSTGAKLNGYARVLRKRNMGAISFWRARFNNETVQLMLVRDQLVDYVQVKKIVPGSIVYVKGEKFITQTGEATLLIKEIEEKISCNWIMPEKFHGISQERRYRQRVLDLICNDDAFYFMRFTTQVTSDIRKLLWEEGFQEFNTGVLQEYFEGGQAEPFRTHCQANGKDLYLSLTSELKLKRLIIAGFERVFEIAQSFRNEGISPFHSPEFTLLEVYAQECNCHDMMDVAESIVRRVSDSYLSGRNGKKPKQDNKIIPISFEGPYKRVPFEEAYAQYAGSFSDCNLASLVLNYPEMFHSGMSKFTWVMKVIEKMIVPKIIEPTFLTELPIGLSPLVKVCEKNSAVTDRAFFVANGIFFADIYSDENDPVKVGASLEAQSRETGRPVNEDYLSLLEYGLPPTAGIGLSLNRLFMVFLEELPKNIKETICYPLL